MTERADTLKEQIAVAERRIEEQPSRAGVWEAALAHLKDELKKEEDT